MRMKHFLALLVSRLYSGLGIIGIACYGLLPQVISRIRVVGLQFVCPLPLENPVRTIGIEGHRAITDDH